MSFIDLTLYQTTNFWTIQNSKYLQTTKCWLPAFSPYPTMFSTGFFSKDIKRRDYLVKSLE